MKKITILSILFLLLIVPLSAHATAALPTNTVSFTPTDAAVTKPITLNALVYNNQNVDVVMTVSFNSPIATVATATATVSAQSARTISAAWTMPPQDTTITAVIAAALNVTTKQSIPTLLGSIGTITVGPHTLLLNGVSFPGSAQLNSWFAPLFAKGELFRVQQAEGFTALRTRTQTQITSSTNQAFGNPVNYVTLIYATIGTALFSNPLIFYIVGILLVLFLLRFIINLIF